MSGCKASEHSAQHARLAEPSPWVRRFAPVVAPGGEVLDLACGAGRHVRYFLARGHPVTALDRDTSRLADLAGEARLTIVEADLESGGAWPLGGARYEAVVVTNYLWRPIMDRIVAAVAPEGVLIYETFARGNERFGRPSNPDHLLEPGELVDAVRGRLAIVAYEHGEIAHPRPAIVQRICAVGAAAPVSLAPDS